MTYLVGELLAELTIVKRNDLHNHMMSHDQLNVVINNVVMVPNVPTADVKGDLHKTVSLHCHL